MEVAPADRVEWVKCRVLFCRRSHLICRNYCHALFMQDLRLSPNAPGCTYASLSLSLSVFFLLFFFSFKRFYIGKQLEEDRLGEGFRKRSADNKMIVFFRV